MTLYQVIAILFQKQNFNVYYSGQVDNGAFKNIQDGLRKNGEDNLASSTPAKTSKEFGTLALDFLNINAIIRFHSQDYNGLEKKNVDDLAKLKSMKRLGKIIMRCKIRKNLDIKDRKRKADCGHNNRLERKPCSNSQGNPG